MIHYNIYTPQMAVRMRNYPGFPEGDCALERQRILLCIRDNEKMQRRRKNIANASKFGIFQNNGKITGK